MLETKQLKYFVTAARCSSFREAAQVLYTTQSNVSKVISQLEDQLGCALFARSQNGITLSSAGEKFCRQAIPLLEVLEKLEQGAAAGSGERVRIAANPSSWFAGMFSAFLSRYREKEICFNIHTDTTLRIVERIHRMEDEIGFVYVFPEHRGQFDYEVKRYGLHYEEFAHVPGMLYYFEDGSKDAGKSLEEVRLAPLVQAESDDTALSDSWSVGGRPLYAAARRPAVTTNSDYIMRVLMEKNGFANISAASFAGGSGHRVSGWCLERPSGLISYGALTNSDHVPGDAVKALARFLRERAVLNEADHAPTSVGLADGCREAEKNKEEQKI